MHNELTIDDYITTLCHLKCFTISQVKEYSENHAKPVLTMIYKNLALTERLEKTLDLENLTEEQASILKVTTLGEVFSLMQLNEITEKTNEES